MITSNARGQQVSLSALNRIKIVRPPGVGKRWQGIPHGKLVWDVGRELEQLGWTISARQSYVSANELELAAEIEVVHDRYPVPVQDSCWTLGIRHGNGRRQGTRFYCGLTMGFDEGFIGCELSATVNKPLITDLKKDIPKVVYWFTDMVHLAVSPTILTWMNQPLDDNQARNLLIKTGELGLLSPSRIYQAIQWFEKLPKPDHTVWNLHMAFAKQVKRSPPLKQMHHLSSFRWLIEKELHKADQA